MARFVTIRRRHGYCGFSDETGRLRGIAPIAFNNRAVPYRTASLSLIYQPETIALYVHVEIFFINSNLFFVLLQ